MTSIEARLPTRVFIIPKAASTTILVLVVLGAIWLWSPPAAITATDQEQPRLNQAAPIPRGLSAVQQTFTSSHNGLSAVEVLAVVYPSEPAGPLTLRLQDARGELVAEQLFQGFAHNTPLRLQFAPQALSANQIYTITLAASGENGATAWAYSLDGYARGRLWVDDVPVSGDLRFSATYTLLWGDLIAESVAAIGQLGFFSAALWAILFAPGVLILSLVHPSWPQNRWARWGLALAMSLSVTPLMWQWTSLIGVKWSPVGLLVATGIVGIATIVRTVLHWHAGRHYRLRWPWHDTALLVLLLVGWLARMWAVRDLAFPMWVDSPHHAVISRLLAETGQVPPSYQPILPIDHFTYHFGFHAVAVTFQWFTSRPMPGSYLLLGQVLNGLMPLAIYALVFAVTSRARAALAAAFFVGWVSLFPAYYVSWGRYTQLAGLVILAPLVAVTWRLTRLGPAIGLSQRVLSIILIAVLASGLFLTHYRVMAFYATFALIAVAAGRRRAWLWMALAAVATGGLCIPWLWRLTQPWFLPMAQSPSRLASPPGYNDFPFAYFQSDLERGWIILAALCLAWGLWRRERLIWALAGWVAVTFATLNIGPGSWLVNNNSWAISLFVPGVLALGWGIDNVGRIAAVWRRTGGRLGRGVAILLVAVLISLCTYAAVHGLRAQVAVVNPATMLATADDAEALEWVDANTPREAVFWVNSWIWSQTVWSVPDGGAWLWPLLGRRTTMPPLDYNLQPDWFAAVNAVNERLSRITEANTPETLALLRENSVTHVFIGARGGTLKPEMFVNASHYRLLFTNGAAWVFEVIYP